MSKTAISVTIDLTVDGKHIGDLKVPWSDNSVPLGYHPVPIISFKNGDGPVFLMCAGTHGDEFEGPSALMRLVNDLNLDEINGQVIIIPGLNFPAVRSSSRVSPLDNINLNRAFPGDPNGNVSDQIAYFVETELLPKADAAIDLHSGGKASVFAACTLATQTEDKTLFAKNLALAHAFGLPFIWVLTGINDPRTLNSAAARAGVPMIATELGGGGGVDPEITHLTEKGLYAILGHVGILRSMPNSGNTAKMIEYQSTEHSLFATGEGVFDRAVSAGETVSGGQLAGRFHYASEPERPSEDVVFPHDGLILAHTNRGYVQRGDMLMIVVQERP